LRGDGFALLAAAADRSLRLHYGRHIFAGLREIHGSVSLARYLIREPPRGAATLSVDVEITSSLPQPSIAIVELAHFLVDVACDLLRRPSA